MKNRKFLNLKEFGTKNNIKFKSEKINKHSKFIKKLKTKWY